MSNWTEADVDNYVGSRIRTRRVELGLSQTVVADQLGLTFQQVQKYERGYNRVSASRLYDLSKILSVDIAYFFEGFRDKAIPETPEAWGPDVLELINAFNSMPEKVRISLRLLLKSVPPGPDDNDDVEYFEQQAVSTLNSPDV